MLRTPKPATDQNRDGKRFHSYLALFAATAAVVLVPLWLATAQAVRAESVERVLITPARARQKVNLRDRLVVGLQARLKTEVAFVELVAARVRSGELPQRLVDETFFWARQRAVDRRSGRARRPIIFFQPAMRARAERIGVEL